MRHIGAEEGKGADIQLICRRENYLLSAAVAAAAFLTGHNKKIWHGKHLTKRKVTERLLRALECYSLRSSDVEFYCMPTTGDHDYKPAGPSKRKKEKPPTAKQIGLRVGDMVLVKRDDGKEELRSVRVVPWKLGHGEWVVGLEGISGGFLLCRCTPQKFKPLDATG